MVPGKERPAEHLGSRAADEQRRQIDAAGLDWRKACGPLCITAGIPDPFPRVVLRADCRFSLGAVVKVSAIDFRVIMQLDARSPFPGDQPSGFSWCRIAGRRVELT